MRDYPIVKSLALLLLLIAPAWADETADRTAIGGVITALNEVSVHIALKAIPLRTEVFTTDSDALAVLEQLFAGKQFTIKLNSISPSSSDQPKVVISHEPWGEAALYFPNAAELVKPMIRVRTIRFITPDVALVDGAYTYEDDGAAVQTTPLLLVMQKVATNWKVASIRILR
jgi:hypothetical protein